MSHEEINRTVICDIVSSQLASGKYKDIIELINVYGKLGKDGLLCTIYELYENEPYFSRIVGMYDLPQTEKAIKKLNWGMMNQKNYLLGGIETGRLSFSAEDKTISPTWYSKICETICKYGKTCDLNALPCLPPMNFIKYSIEFGNHAITKYFDRRYIKSNPTEKDKLYHFNDIIEGYLRRGVTIQKLCEYKLCTCYDRILENAAIGGNIKTMVNIVAELACKDNNKSIEYVSTLIEYICKYHNNPSILNNIINKFGIIHWAPDRKKDIFIKGLTFVCLNGNHNLVSICIKNGNINKTDELFLPFANDSIKTFNEVVSGLKYVRKDIMKLTEQLLKNRQVFTLYYLYKKNYILPTDEITIKVFYEDAYVMRIGNNLTIAIERYHDMQTAARAIREENDIYINHNNNNKNNNNHNHANKKRKLLFTKDSSNH